jgi:hypothetical protein
VWDMVVYWAVVLVLDISVRSIYVVAPGEWQSYISTEVLICTNWEINYSNWSFCVLYCVLCYLINLSLVTVWWAG